MIILGRDSAKHLFKKGVWEVDTYKYSPGMTGYIFEDTLEVREILANVELDPMWDKVN